MPAAADWFRNVKAKAVNSRNWVGHCYDLGNLPECKFLSINPKFEQLYTIVLYNFMVRTYYFPAFISAVGI